MEEKQEIAIVAEMDIVSPASAEKILEAFKAFEWMKQNVITSNDKQKIGDRYYIKKSGWMKVALACNISLEKREERVEKVDEETVYHYTYRAIAPNGRFVDADASASSGERKFTHLPHDVRALAQTRASNRAVSNLSGGAEVSAEEMISERQAEDRKTKPPPKERSIKKPLRQKTVHEADVLDALNAADLDENILNIRYDLETEGLVISVKGTIGKVLWKKYDSVMRKLGLSWDSSEKPNVWK